MSILLKPVQTPWEMGFKEIDMSLTGDENVKSTRMQDHLGFKVYRRYRIYEKGLSNERPA